MASLVARLCKAQKVLQELLEEGLLPPGMHQHYIGVLRHRRTQQLHRTFLFSRRSSSEWRSKMSWALEV